MGNPIKILVVDRAYLTHQRLAAELKSRGVELLSAYTLREAEQLFLKNPDVALIVVAARIDEELDTEPFVRKARETFSGPMIAAAGTLNLRNLLRGAGCSHECDKPSLAAKIKEVLGLP